jgi:hypothetical protein
VCYSQVLQIATSKLPLWSDQFQNLETCFFGGWSNKDCVYLWHLALMLHFIKLTVSAKLLYQLVQVVNIVSIPQVFHKSSCYDKVYLQGFLQLVRQCHLKRWWCWTHLFQKLAALSFVALMLVCWFPCLCRLTSPMVIIYFPPLAPDPLVVMIISLLLLKVSMLIVRNRRAFQKHGSRSRQEYSSFGHFSHAMNVLWDSSISQFSPCSDSERPVLS